MLDNSQLTITDADINKLEQIFVTKNEFQKHSELILTRFDALMHELQIIRDELIALTYRNSENSDKLENHEASITTIEDKIAF